MPTSSALVHKRSAKLKRVAPRKQRAGLGVLPEWKLDDLYSGMDAPEVRRDLDRADNYSVVFEDEFKGKLASMASAPDASARLTEAVKRYEMIDDLLGRLISYASLVYSGDTSDPKRTKFFGDVQERITTASSHLLFFTLELNRIDEAVLQAAVQSEPLAHYRPWLEDIRRDKPYQLEDRVEQLFHEKSVTAYGAWNRLFDETISGLRFSVGGEKLPIEPTLNPLQDSDETVRKRCRAGAGQDVRGEPARVHADHQHARQGQGNIRSLAWLSPTLPRPAIWPTGSNPRSWMRWLRRSRRLSPAFAPLLRAQGEMVRQDAPAALGPQRAGSQGAEPYDCAGPRRAIPCCRPTARSRRAWHRSRSVSSTSNWIDAPARPGKAPGAFAHPTVPSAHPYVLLNYKGKPRDVMTLAHELGHGVHQVLAAPNGPLMAPTPLTLAETACVFGEMLTFRRLLANDRQEAAQGDARRQGRGHDQHGRAPDRVLHVSSARSTPSGQAGELTAGPVRRSSGSRCRPKALGRRSSSSPATRRSGPISATSCIRRSTSTPMRSATAW